MQTAPKYVHIAAHSLAGRSTAVALCGRLVGRLSLTIGEASATCPKCLAESLSRTTQNISKGA